MIRKNDELCATCGKARSEWRANNSEAVNANGKIYCCDSCAEGKECTCEMLQTAPRPMRNVDATDQE